MGVAHNQYILDSYAILALVNDEPGAERVAFLLKQASDPHYVVAMSLNNLGEVAYIIERRWGIEKTQITLAYLEATGIQFVEVEKNRVLSAAHLKAKYPIAYADAFAAALAIEMGATLLTGDPEFQALSSQLDIEWLANGS
jgi:predicted nucleic acid-binding protein